MPFIKYRLKLSDTVESSNLEVTYLNRFELNGQHFLSSSGMSNIFEIFLVHPFHLKSQHERVGKSSLTVTLRADPLQKVFNKLRRAFHPERVPLFRQKVATRFCLKSVNQ